MAEFYDVYPKDRWREPDYKLMDKFSLKGKKCFVTGAAGGIGRNTAAAWAEAGADVALVDLEVKADDLQKLAEEMSQKYGVKVIPLFCDVSDYDQVKKLKEDLIKELGTVDIAHINAGVCLDGDDIDTDYETWKKTIDIDLNGAFATTKVAYDIMREHKHGGSIIVTSSLSGHNANYLAGGPTPVLAYGSAKAALCQMVRYLGAALAPYDIRVNTISPGWVWSGIHEGRMPKEAHDLALEMVPIKRFGRNDDLQGAILYLSSEASAYVTGIDIPVDGGYAIY